MLILEEYLFYCLAVGVFLLFVLAIRQGRLNTQSRVILSLVSSGLMLCGHFSEHAGNWEDQVWLLGLGAESVFACYQAIDWRRSTSAQFPSEAEVKSV